jgi:hypothetical protein
MTASKKNALYQFFGIDSNEEMFFSGMGFRSRAGAYAGMGFLLKKTPQNQGNAEIKYNNYFIFLTITKARTNNRNVAPILNSVVVASALSSKLFGLKERLMTLINHKSGKQIVTESVNVQKIKSAIVVGVGHVVAKCYNMAFNLKTSRLCW